MTSISASATASMAAVTVYTFGVHYRWELPEIVEAQLRLAHDAQEDFVALHLAYDADIKAIWSSYPGVATAEADLENAESVLALLTEQTRAQRIEQSSRRTGPAVEEQLRQAKRLLSEVRQARRDAITAVRDDSAPRRRDRLVQLRADQKALYGKYASLGLYWATFNAIAANHKALVQRVNTQRREGRPAQLRHRRFDGTGTLTVQIQRRDAAPVRTPSILADTHGRYSYFAVVPWIEPRAWESMGRAERRAAGRGMVRMRVGTADGEPQWVNIPVQAHRWLPANADISHVRLTVKRTAARRTAQVQVSARINQQRPATSDRAPAVAVHLGWRQTEFGVQVASWRSTGPLHIPATLESVMAVDSGGGTGQILIPPGIMARLDRADRIAASRAESLAAVRAALAAWLDEHGSVAHLGRDLVAKDVRQWRSAAQFAALSKAWRDDGRVGDVGALLEGWRKTDVRLWDRQEHGRRRALGHRDDLYRQVAAAIAEQARVVVVDDMDLSEIARVTRSDPEVWGALRRSAERRHRAAPGRLRNAVAGAARRAGARCELVSPKGLARVHADCGHENPVDGRYASPVVVCDRCGEQYVVDGSTTLLMLRAAGVVL